MRFKIEHETRYRYSQPVFFEPHLVRLKPRCDASQKLIAFSLRVFPQPAGICEIADPSGNPVIRLWFEGLHDELLLHTRLTAATLRVNPFDYLLEPAACKLPLGMSEPERRVLAPCLESGASPAVSQLCGLILEQSGHETQDFLHRLNLWLHSELAVTVRQDPGLQSAQQTLDLRSGACRDLTLVFMEVCRAAGIPARFASCYQAGDPGQLERDLHAYPEVYLPGAGWRGYDPTLGLVVSESHLAICASPLPLETAPLSGTFRGSGARGELEHQIELEIFD